MCVTSWADKLDYDKLTPKERREIKKKLQKAAAVQTKKNEAEMKRINTRIARLSQPRRQATVTPLRVVNK